MGFNQSLIIRKNPVVIVKNFIALQMAAVAAFFIAGLLADYGDIYEHLPLAGSLSFHVAQAIGIFVIETALVFLIFFRWHKEFYNIKSDTVIHGKGILYHKKTVVPLKSVHTVSYSQGPLGKLTKYGSIELRDGLSGKDFVMDHIPEPQYYTQLITQMRGALSPDNEGEFSLEKTITKGEHERLEFKTSLRWDRRRNKVNKDLEKSVMKTVAAFLNSGGGYLVLGVDDSGNVLGLDDDYQSLPKSNSDGFQNHFSNVFHSLIGPEYRQFIALSIHRVDNKECCLVHVKSSDKPAYLKVDRGDEFYIRTGNGTTSLRLSEANSYIDSHWRGKLL